jgi:hypothetical protein
MPHVYTVKLDDGRNVMHVEAENKGEAKRFALSNVEVERLDGSQVVALSRRGVAIVSAKTGKVCNGPEADEGEPE